MISPISILADIAPVQPRAFDINPALSPWLLFIGAVIAATSVLYLYTAQTRVASRAIVSSLTTIRIVLILLVIVMLLGPVRQWATRRHSNGTLFVLVDQSLSMQQKDPQATDRERLEWADALGFLPENLRLDSACIAVHRLTALRDDMDHFRSDSDHLLSSPDASHARDELAAHLADWQKNLDACANDLAADSRIKSSAPELNQSLHTAADTMGKSITQIGAGTHRSSWVWLKLTGAAFAISGLVFVSVRRKSLLRSTLNGWLPAIYMALAMLATSLFIWAALSWPVSSDDDVREHAVVRDSTEISWQALRDTLTRSITQVASAAVAEETDFLSRHGTSPQVKEALAKIAQLSRADLAFAALSSSSSHQLKSISERMSQQDVKIVPFGDRTVIMSPEKKDLTQAMHAALTDPKEQSTDIASALKFVSEQAGEDSTVLIVSDGRQNVGTEPEAPARFLASHGTRVYTLTLGSHQLARDAAVDHVDAPDWVYAEDEVIISPVIRLDALQGRDVTVELHRDDAVVDTRVIRAKSDQEKVRLRLVDHPPKEGLFNYTTVIKPVAGEAVADNNAQSVRVAVKKDRLNVLIVEDEPGWEYQFLRNYLIRDHRVKLQVVLLSPGHIEQVQAPAGELASPTRDDGKIDAQVMPSTLEQWSAFDIVILGDIPPERFAADQQTNLVTALRDGGVKALLLLAGQRNMPMRYAATPLADVLPVDLSGSRWTPQVLQDQLRHGFIPALAPDGVGSVLGQLSEDFGTNGQIWANLPLWYWHSEQTAARPGASVLWSIEDAVTADAKANGNTPSPQDSLDAYQATRQHALLASLNVGLGRVLYLASPQTWRLRYVQTPGDDSHIEDVHRRFWGQVVRWAVGNDLPAGGKFVRFGTNKHSYIGGEPIVITARVLNQNFTPLQGATFKIIATRNDGSRAGVTTMVEAASEGAGIYRGTTALPAGSFTLSVQGGEPERLLNLDDTTDAAQKTLPVDISPDATIEDRDVNADPERMASIAKAGSGIAMDGSYFDVLANHLPVVDHTQTQVVQAGLFSNPDDSRTRIVHWAFFTLFVILITAEWILRKRGGLV